MRNAHVKIASVFDTIDSMRTDYRHRINNLNRDMQLLNKVEQVYEVIDSMRRDYKQQIDNLETDLIMLGNVEHVLEVIAQDKRWDLPVFKDLHCDALKPSVPGTPITIGVRVAHWYDPEYTYRCVEFAITGHRLFIRRYTTPERFESDDPFTFDTPQACADRLFDCIELALMALTPKTTR